MSPESFVDDEPPNDIGIYKHLCSVNIFHVILKFAQSNEFNSAARNGQIHKRENIDSWKELRRNNHSGEIKTTPKRMYQHDNIPFK